MKEDGLTGLTGFIYLGSFKNFNDFNGSGSAYKPYLSQAVYRSALQQVSVHLGLQRLA